MCLRQFALRVLSLLDVPLLSLHAPGRMWPHTYHLVAPPSRPSFVCPGLLGPGAGAAAVDC